MVESHKTLQALICDILFPCGDRVTSDEQEKLRQKKKTLCQKIGVGAGGEHERVQDWTYGTGVTVRLCCEKQYAMFDISIF